MLGAAELLGHRQHPLDQRARGAPRAGARLAGGEVDQLARKAVADRAPEVLLDQPVREVGQRLALVEGARDPGGQRVAERGERARLGEVGLPVADPDLDRREGEMRADAPPELRVLVDRAGVVEEADVALEAVPARRRRPGRRSAGTCRVKICVRAECSPVFTFSTNGELALEGQQLGQEVPQPVADGDRAVGAVDRDVHVEAEAVVAPDDVPEDLVVAAVVRRVDDPLVLPAGSTGACRSRPSATPERVGELVAAARAARRCRAAASSNVSQRPVRTSTSEAISSPTRCSSSAVPCAAACSSSKRFVQVERLGVEDGELLLDREREVLAASNCSRARASCSSGLRLLGCLPWRRT